MTPFIWGVNGHPQYGLTAAQQMSLINSLGLKSYRVDTYDASQSTINYLSSLKTAAAPYGISILPVIVPSAAASNTETNAYNYGFSTASTLAAAFPGLIWEMGNEMDEFSRINTDGTQTTDYDDAKYALCRGSFNGIYAGLHAADPSARGIIDITGNHFGFLNRLAGDGVKWDITGSHFYASGTAGMQQGAVSLFAQFAAYGKPILMTEFNRVDGSAVSQQDESDVLIAMMKAAWSCAGPYKLIGAYIYELLDEPGLSGGEAVYGIATNTGTLKTAGTSVQSLLSSAKVASFGRNRVA